MQHNRKYILIIPPEITKELLSIEQDIKQNNIAETIDPIIYNFHKDFVECSTYGIPSDSASNEYLYEELFDPVGEQYKQNDELFVRVCNVKKALSVIADNMQTHIEELNYSHFDGKLNAIIYTQNPHQYSLP